MSSASFHHSHSIFEVSCAGRQEVAGAQMSRAEETGGGTAAIVRCVCVCVSGWVCVCVGGWMGG